MMEASAAIDGQGSGIVVFDLQIQPMRVLVGVPNW
jgi:hypothetical protein